MNTFLLGIKPSMFGQAKHTFRTGTVWNAHLECVMALRDPKYQKSNKLSFWTQHLCLFIAQALIFSGCQASMDTTVVWRVLVLFNQSNFGKIQQGLWFWSQTCAKGRLFAQHYFWNCLKNLPFITKGTSVWAHFLFYPSLSFPMDKGTGNYNLWIVSAETWESAKQAQNITLLL